MKNIKKSIYKTFKVLSLLLTLNFLLLTSFCFSQSGAAINTTGTSADPSAMLDVSGVSKGVLINRMNTAERNAINTPAEGLIIFNITTKCLEIYINPMWQSIFCGCNPPVATTAGTHIPAQTEITWNWNSVAGAIGYKYHTANDYSNAIDNGINTYLTQSGLECDSSYLLYVWSYNGCGNSSEVLLSEATSVCPWICGDLLSINHTSGSVAPVTKSINYNTILSSMGGSGDKCWITQNLGSSNQASSATDPSEVAAGWYWQFNKIQGYKHDGTNRTPNTSWITSISENSDWQLLNDPCYLELGANWRIPTYNEWINANTTGSWTNYNNAYNSILKLHTAGRINDSNGALVGRNIYGYYWNNQQNGNSQAWTLHFTSSYSGMTSFVKAYALTIRCIKD